MFQGPQRKVDVLELTDFDTSKESNFYENKKVFKKSLKNKNVFTVLFFKTVEQGMLTLTASCCTVSW